VHAVIHTEAQDGKTPLDTHFALGGGVVRRYVSCGHDVTTTQELYAALTSNGVVQATFVDMLQINRDVTFATRGAGVTGVRKIAEIHFLEDGGMRLWESSQIGEGLLVPKAGLDSYVDSTKPFDGTRVQFKHTDEEFVVKLLRGDVYKQLVQENKKSKNKRVEESKKRKREKVLALQSMAQLQTGLKYCPNCKERFTWQKWMDKHQCGVKKKSRVEFVAELAATALLTRIDVERSGLEPVAMDVDSHVQERKDVGSAAMGVDSHIEERKADAASSAHGVINVRQGFAVKPGSRERAPISDEVMKFFEKLFERGLKADGSSNRGKKVSGAQAAELMQAQFDRSDWLDAKECRALFTKIASAKRAQNLADQQGRADHAAIRTVVAELALNRGESSADNQPNDEEVEADGVESDDDVE